MDVARLIQSVRKSTESLDEGDQVKNISELEILLQRRREEDRKKARYHWMLLRNTIRSTVDAVSDSYMKDLVISHGIHHERKINHSQSIQQVVFIETRKEYLTSDGKNFRIFLEDGRKKSVVTPEEPMNRVVYASQTNQFVGWIDREEQIYLLSENFNVVSEARTPGRIFIGTYNHNAGEMVIVGPNFLQSWAFRYGARHLIPRLTSWTEFGEDNMFSLMVLEETASRNQRVFFACGAGIVVFSLFEGKMLCHRKELHVRTITAVTFFNPLKYLVTGAQDGSIKIWDNNWHVVMVFVGHSDMVNAIAIYPNGPAIISASFDCTIRVWNLETCDEVDRVPISEPVEGLGTYIQYNMFYTFSGHKVDLWRLQHLYQVHTAIGHRVNNIKLTDHPNFPVRAVLMCRDSSIRIVSPPTGDVITTLLMDPSKGLIDAAYAVAEETMFTVIGNGDIIKCKTDTNPCKIVTRWEHKDSREICNYLLVYEYVVESMTSNDIWGITKRGIATQSISNLAKHQNRNRTLLLGGRRDGYICVFNWNTGAVDFKVEAHGSKGVLNMIANSKADQLISAGMDNVIKVWRLYPFAEEALAPLMSFYCAHTPSHMTTIKSNLGVVFQDPLTATFSMVVYNLKDKMMSTGTQNLDAFQNRFDHKPDDDHIDLITGLTACPRMKLFASCSMDGTIRIWNDTNTLVRLMKLNVSPYSIGFCSQRGDLLLGTGDHLFKIPYDNYMPKVYKFRMVSMKFGPEVAQDPLPYDDNLLNQMSKQNVKRLKNSHSSFKFTNFVDVLSAEEENEVKKEKLIKEQAFSVIEARENELRMIRDGKLKAKRQPKSTEKTKSEAFMNYMKMFYDKPKITLPEEDLFPEDTVQEALESPSKELTGEMYIPEKEPVGFFTPGSQTKKPKFVPVPGSPLKPAYPMCSKGFIPNSVLVKILWPPPQPVVDAAKRGQYIPPSLTSAQMAQIHSLDQPEDDDLTSLPKRSVTFATSGDDSIDITTRVIDFNYDDDEEEEDEQEREEEQEEDDSHDIRSPTSPVPLKDTPTKTPMKIETPETPSRTVSSAGKKSSILSKFQEIMERSSTPESEEEIEITADKTDYKTPSPGTGPATPSPALTAALILPKPPVKREIKMLKPLQPIVPQPKLPIPAPPLSISPSVSPAPSFSRSYHRSPTPPPPPTPLPEFISQFKGSAWFEKYYPNCSENTMPKPWTADGFANMIVRLLRIAEFVHKRSVVEALILLHTQEDLTGATSCTVSKSVMSVLNHHSNPPICSVEEQKNFILVAIRCLQVMAPRDKDFVTEMILQFLDGDREVRSTVLDIFAVCGLQDPHRQFQKELDSWDIWNLEEDDRKSDLRKMCHQWLDRWMTSYKLHIEDTINRIKKGQNVHGQLSRSQLQKHQGRGNKGKSTRVDDDQSTTTTLPDGVEFIPRGKSTPTSSRSVTVTFDKMPDGNLAETATYMDALNYFCEMMTEKEIEAMKTGKRVRRPGMQEDKSGAPKNTVLVLPKLPHKPALVRLGETHTSYCRPKRETVFSVDFACPSLTTRGRQPVPGQLSGFVPCINLPMKTLYVNPFPCSMDAYDNRFQEPILITLKSAQKYFIPSQSHIPLEPAGAPSS